MGAVTFTLLSFYLLHLSSIVFGAASDGFHGEDSGEFMKTCNWQPSRFKKEKLTQFTLYWHDIISGPNSSGFAISMPDSNPKYSPFSFALTRVIDNPLTVGAELTSKKVGSAQGIYSQASQSDFSFLMAMNFVFTEGRYNGSTITVLGRNLVRQHVREMPVVGGSGRFKLARGFVRAKTRQLNLTTGDATVKYRAFILHY